MVIYGPVPQHLPTLTDNEQTSPPRDHGLEHVWQSRSETRRYVALLDLKMVHAKLLLVVDCEHC